MSTSDLFKTAHAAARAARAASPTLATSERYAATYSRALRALRASLQAPRAGRWARVAPGAPPAAWLAGDRPRVGERLQLDRRAGAGCWCVASVEAAPTRRPGARWRVRVARVA